MFTEDFILQIVKTSEYGVEFTNTVKGIIRTISERIVFEDMEGAQWINKIIIILNDYINFHLRESLISYAEIRINLSEFIDIIQTNELNSSVRKITWRKIINILDHLAEKGEHFIEIAKSEVRRLNQIPQKQ